MSIPLVRTVADLRAQVGAWHSSGERVALVPTMGALHEGHLSLVRAARGRAQRVVTTIFVNPTQFNNPEDLAKYPRTEESDLAKLAGEAVDLVYAPDAKEMYPAGFATTISVSGVSEGLCGAFRPGHFDGVATVVAKLFLQSRADVAVFGEKDFQQLAVIRRMARDLDIPVEIIGAATVREADGLALSSRNVRLSPEGRERAPVLATTLESAARAIEAGAPAADAIADARARILASGFTEVEYCELRDSATLDPVGQPTRPARLLAAAWLDGVRLIDNVAVVPG